MAMKLDTLNSSLNLALEHKQDTDTAVVTSESSVNYIGKLTAGYAQRVLRDTNDYTESLVGNGTDFILHSLWFSVGDASYQASSKEDRELEQLRAWSKTFGVTFKSGRPVILGMNSVAGETIVTEVDISGNSLHTDYINKPLGIKNFDKNVAASARITNHEIQGNPQTYVVGDNVTVGIWTYSGDRGKHTFVGTDVDEENKIGTDCCDGLSNIVLDSFFQKEGDGNAYYRVLSEERIANKNSKGKKSTSTGVTSPNAFKIVTLDKDGVIPDNFLGEMKLDEKLGIGGTTMTVVNNQFILASNDGASDFVLQIQPDPNIASENLTELKQSEVKSKDIKGVNVTATKKLLAEKEAIVKETLVIGNGNFTKEHSAANVSIDSDTVRASNILSTRCLTIPVFSSAAAAQAAYAAAPSGTAAIWLAAY